MQPLSAIDARQVELLRMGDLLAHLGGQELALRIAKRGGSTSQFLRPSPPAPATPARPAARTPPWALTPAAMPVPTRSVA